jgi:hypothetical protein
VVLILVTAAAIYVYAIRLLLLLLKAAAMGDAADAKNRGVDPMLQLVVRRKSSGQLVVCVRTGPAATRGCFSFIDRLCKATFNIRIINLQYLGILIK